MFAGKTRNVERVSKFRIYIYTKYDAVSVSTSYIFHLREFF